MDKFETIHEGLNFRESKGHKLVAVTNNLSYLMAEYSCETGITKWSRVVAAAQREKVENWLRKNYPVRSSVN